MIGGSSGEVGDLTGMRCNYLVKAWNSIQKKHEKRYICVNNASDFNDVL